MRRQASMRFVAVMCKWTQRSKQCLYPLVFVCFLSGIFLMVKPSNPSAGASANKIKESRQLLAREITNAVQDSTSLGSRSTVRGPRWFDPEELLSKTVKELENVGWKVPRGSIDLQIQKIGKHHKQMENVATVPQKDILATSERWKVFHVGCFSGSQTRPALRIVSTVTVQSSVGKCSSKCVELGRNYISLFEGRLCRCGTMLSKAVLGIDVKSEQCNMKCKVNTTQYCGGVKYASIYRIAEHKKDDLTMATIRKGSAGCFVKPKELDAAFASVSIDAKPNAANCLLRCENSNFVMASWDNTQQCQCGRFDSKFPIHLMGNSVDDTLCDSYCDGEFQTCTTKYVRIMRTYANDDRCDDRNFLPHTIGRLVALISFPGSGNTWVRHLIETATGIYTGSVYHDPELYTNGFIGELLPWNSRRTSVIKTHQFGEEDVAKFEEAIFIVRSPYDAIMAEFNRVSGGHVGYADPELFKSMEWVYFIAYKMSKWIRSIQHYSVMDKILVVYFEDIVSNPEREVRKMVEFLAYPIANIEERLACLVTNLSGSFKRPKRTLPFDPYTTKSKVNVNTYIKTAREIFAGRNLPPLPPYERY